MRGRLFPLFAQPNSGDERLRRFPFSPAGGEGKNRIVDALIYWKTTSHSPRCGAVEPLLDRVDLAAHIKRHRLAAGPGHRQRNDRHVFLEGRDISHLRRIDVNRLIVSVLETDQRHPTLLFHSGGSLNAMRRLKEV